MKYIKTFENYQSENPSLFYYAFDIDDNLIYSPTTILMEHLVDGEWIDVFVDTEQFAVVRTDKDWRFKPGQESFVNFQDWGPNGDDTFIKDFKSAVYNKKFGPSWNKFIECLVNGNIFSIVTSRGHSPKNVRRAFEWLIYEYGLDKFKKYPIKNVDKNESFEDQMIENLLKYHELFGSEPSQVIDEYLEICPIYTVSSKEFFDAFGESSVEIAKKRALHDFNKLVKGFAQDLGVRASLGFSDDDPRFVKSALDQFQEMKEKDDKYVKYSIFDTGAKGMKKMDV